MLILSMPQVIYAIWVVQTGGLYRWGYKYKVLHTNRLKPGHGTFKAAQLQSHKGF